MSGDEGDDAGRAVYSVYISLCFCRRYVPHTSSHHVTPANTWWNAKLSAFSIQQQSWVEHVTVIE